MFSLKGLNPVSIKNYQQKLDKQKKRKEKEIERKIIKRQNSKIKDNTDDSILKEKRR